jgi:DNA-binding GntR family transcriptional regulator
LEPSSIFGPIAFRSETLSEKVYEAIREAIDSRRLPPGERVTEASLASQLSVSKTPVREALLRLEQVGLVQADGSRGASVVQASPSVIRDAFEYRLALEVEAARLAAARADEASIAAIAHLADVSLVAARRQDRPAFLLSDRKFHLEIADAAGNARLAAGVRDAMDLTGALRSRDAIDTQNSVACAERHVDIAEAIRRRAEDEVSTLIRNHLKSVQELVVKGFIRDGGSRPPDS